jgi:predicted N-acetyltransferase YhbS
MRPIIRFEVPSDASAIHAVTVTAFRNAPRVEQTE